jgi:hypothetical protein
VGVSTIVAETLAAATISAPRAADTPAADKGIVTSFPGGSLVIPEGLASGVSSENVEELIDGGPGWGNAPAHILITLEGYSLQGQFHEPQIWIFPAAAYAQVNEAAGSQIQALRKAVASPSSPLTDDLIPTVPFFNAASVFTSQVAPIQFQNGRGLRLVTEYAQYFATINNNDLFYQFQGLSSDEQTYIVAVLPVTAPLLAAAADPSSVPPAGGIVFPGFDNPNTELIAAYYESVTKLLNATPQEQFMPSLAALDALVQSLEVSP